MHELCHFGKNTLKTLQIWVRSLLLSCITMEGCKFPNYSFVLLYQFLVKLSVCFWEMLHLQLADPRAVYFPLWHCRGTKAELIGLGQCRRGAAAGLWYHREAEQPPKPPAGAATGPLHWSDLNTASKQQLTHTYIHIHRYQTLGHSEQFRYTNANTLF